MFVAAITSAVILGFIGLSVTKLNSMVFRSLDTSGISRQAQEYASARADMVKGIKYSELQGMSKKSIDGSKGYYEEVLLGGEVTVPEDSSMMKRNLTINVYKDSETVPRASLVVPRYSSGDSTGQYVVNNAFNAEKSKKLSLDVDKNNRFVAADDKGNSQKLLSNITETYKGDLNNLKETGIFSGSNLGNAPDTGAYSIENIRQSDVSGVYVNQRVTKFNENKTYTRQCRNGTWSAWSEFGGGNSNLKITYGYIGDNGRYNWNPKTGEKYDKTFKYDVPWGGTLPVPEGFTREQCHFIVVPIMFSVYTYETSTAIGAIRYNLETGYVNKGNMSREMVDVAMYICIASK